MVTRSMLVVGVGLVTGIVLAPAVAQQSASYRLHEHVLHAGGRPAQRARNLRDARGGVSRLLRRLARDPHRGRDTEPARARGRGRRRYPRQWEFVRRVLREPRARKQLRRGRDRGHGHRRTRRHDGRLYGIQGFGSFAGGCFKCNGSGNTGEVWLGDHNRGVWSRGTECGGYFYDSDGSGYATLGVGNTGLLAGGSFQGIEVTGGSWAGHFEDSTDGAEVYLAYGAQGIQTLGPTYGGYFVDTDSGGQAYVGFSSYKIQGVGTVSFVQNHPDEPDRVIVYHAWSGVYGSASRSWRSCSPGAARRHGGFAIRGARNAAPSSVDPRPGAAEVEVVGAGFARLNADAGYGAIRPGDLLVSSPTAGHAMRATDVVPGTALGKALEGLEVGTGTIRVLLLSR